MAFAMSFSYLTASLTAPARAMRASTATMAAKPLSAVWRADVPTSASLRLLAHHFAFRREARYALRGLSRDFRDAAYSLYDLAGRAEHGAQGGGCGQEARYHALVFLVHVGERLCGVRYDFQHRLRRVHEFKGRIGQWGADLLGNRDDAVLQYFELGRERVVAVVDLCLKRGVLLPFLVRFRDRLAHEFRIARKALHDVDLAHGVYAQIFEHDRHVAALFGGVLHACEQVGKC